MFKFLIPLVLGGTALYFLMRTRRPGAAPAGTVDVYLSLNATFSFAGYLNNENLTPNTSY